MLQQQNGAYTAGRRDISRRHKFNITFLFQIHQKPLADPYPPQKIFIAASVPIAHTFVPIGIFLCKNRNSKRCITS
jgi:hypothetical protein